MLPATRIDRSSDHIGVPSSITRPWRRHPVLVACLLPFVVLFVAALYVSWAGTNIVELSVVAQVYAGLFGWGVLGLPSFVVGIRRTSGSEPWILVVAAVGGAVVLSHVLRHVIPPLPEADYCTAGPWYSDVMAPGLPPKVFHCRSDTYTMAGAILGWWAALYCIRWWRSRSAG